MPGRNKLIYDTDGGVDDAQALLMLIGNDRAPDAVTTVFGNVGVDVATRNVLETLAVAGAHIEVHKGAGAPLAQEIIDARHVHGEDGLGGAPRPAMTADLASMDAVGFLVATLSQAAANGEEVDLLMVGPMTNLARALQRDPEIVRGIGRLTQMGGTVYGRGNTTPAAEFNILADPEAAAIVFSSDIDMVVVPWEPCTTHVMSGADVDRLFETVAPSEYSVFSQALVQHARTQIARGGHGDVFRFVDPLAAAVVIDPEIVTKSVEASIGVALAPGITRGMTVVDPSGRLGTPSVTLIEEVNLDRLVALYAKSVAYLPKR